MIRAFECAGLLTAVLVFMGTEITGAEPVTVTGAPVQAIKDSVVSSQIPDSANPFNALIIRTEPSGAAVVFDDSAVGLSPVTLTAINNGTHIIELRKKGYYLKKVELSLDSSSPREYSFTLLQPGGLIISSVPPGARVLIDAKETGTTPLFQRALKPGNHSVRIEMENYSPVDSSIAISSGVVDTLSIQLELNSTAAKSASKAAPAKSPLYTKVNRIVTASVFGLFALTLFITESIASR